MELTLSSDVGQSLTSTPRPLMLVTNGPDGYRACTPFSAAATHAQAASARREPWRGMAAAQRWQRRTQLLLGAALRASTRTEAGAETSALGAGTVSLAHELRSPLR